MLIVIKTYYEIPNIKYYFLLRKADINYLSNGKTYIIVICVVEFISSNFLKNIYLGQNGKWDHWLMYGFPYFKKP